ncbi:hypothetical protein JNB88_10140 [Rhizobium cauense]|uniref:hypothetical protein n=1 Tax=Rhizobium cauense TaxID=1166683 RepID=UPI00056C3D33|nr:hypothetical protein [Rhizobium cauense]MBW9113996.1 hypothetical protein [Rhizobium cauense]
MQDLTVSEALKDPLIQLLLRADKTSLGQFAQILESAARRRHLQLAARNLPIEVGPPGPKYLVD